jgi:hypothetical protein
LLNGMYERWDQHGCEAEKEGNNTIPSEKRWGRVGATDSAVLRRRLRGALMRLPRPSNGGERTQVAWGSAATVGIEQGSGGAAGLATTRWGFRSSNADLGGRGLNVSSRQRLTRDGGRARFAPLTPTSSGRGSGWRRPQIFLRVGRNGGSARVALTFKSSPSVLSSNWFFLLKHTCLLNHAVQSKRLRVTTQMTRDEQIYKLWSCLLSINFVLS